MEKEIEFEDYELSESERVIKKFLTLHRVKLLKMAGKCDIFPGQMQILIFISHNNGLSQREIAQAFKFKAASVTEALKRMEKLQLVTRKQDENDLRITRVYISEKGMELVNLGIDVSYEMEKCCFEGFSEHEKKLFISFLERMCKNLDDSSGGAK